MARLVGVDLPREKRLEIALTYIFGVGRTRATQTLAATGVSPNMRVQGPDRRGARHSCATTSRATSRSRVTCAARSPPTSAARSRSAATRASGTAAACRCAVSAPSTNARTRKGPKRTVAGKKKAGKK